MNNCCVCFAYKSLKSAKNLKEPEGNNGKNIGITEGKHIPDER